MQIVKVVLEKGSRHGVAFDVLSTSDALPIAVEDCPSSGKIV
jgi:hypothetical protein